MSQCLEWTTSPYLEDFYPGQYRVFRPAQLLPQAGWTAHHFDMAVQAMEESVKYYKAQGALPPVNVVFAVLLNGKTNAFAHPTAGKPCGVALFPLMQSMPDPQFKQVVAHEFGHCFKQDTFLEQNLVRYEFIMWREEGLADFLSNLVYPAGLCDGKRCDREWRRMEKLSAIELGTTLFDRSYENNLFFQFLQWELGVDGIKSLVLSLPNSGERVEQEHQLASWPDIERLYHEFALQMSDGRVKDSGAGVVPFTANAFPVTIDGIGTPLLNEDFKPFAVARYQLSAA